MSPPMAMSISQPNVTTSVSEEQASRRKVHSWLQETRSHLDEKMNEQRSAFHKPRQNELHPQSLFHAPHVPPPNTLIASAIPSSSKDASIDTDTDTDIDMPDAPPLDACSDDSTDPLQASRHTLIYHSTPAHVLATNTTHNTMLDRKALAMQTVRDAALTHARRQYVASDAFFASVGLGSVKSVCELPVKTGEVRGVLRGEQSAPCEKGRGVRFNECVLRPPYELDDGAEGDDESRDRGRRGRRGRGGAGCTRAK